MKDRIIPYLEDFESKLLNAATDELSRDSPLAFNSFCSACREVVRSVLHRLAPDEEIKQCGWFTPDSTSSNGITRKHRVYYAVQGGLSDTYVQTELRLDISEMHKTLKNAIDDLSKYTHVNEKTFAISPTEAAVRSKEILTALFNLFSSIQSLRSAICGTLQKQLDETAIGSALSETILEIDELSTHHYIDDIDCEQYLVTSISSREILINVHGTIYVELQWGSNSDIRNDMGAIIPQDFPFTCTISAPLSEINELSVDDNGFRVDVSSWRDSMDDNG